MSGKTQELFSTLQRSWGATDEDWREVYNLCRQLVILAGKHERFAIRECQDPNITNKDHAEWQKVEDRIKAVCKKLPKVRDKDTGLLAEITPVFNGDPRGATVKLKMPDGRYDSWGGEGICVPTNQR